LIGFRKISLNAGSPCNRIYLVGSFTFHSS
jgi:hypothetical protein